MPDLTPAHSHALDALRRVFQTDEATLVLLDYARPGRRGYDALIDVTEGWNLDSGTNIGDLMILEIAESETVTRELLNKAVAFGIYIPGISDPEKVWVMEGDEGRKAPTEANTRLWTFQVKPSGEDVER